MDIPNIKEERNLECPVCLEILCKPRILTSCGHTLCSECITIMSKKNGKQYSIDCPNCSKTTYYVGEVDNLNKNYSLHSIIEEFNSKKISNSFPRENYLNNKNLKTQTKKSKSLPDLQIYKDDNGYSNIINVSPYIAKPVQDNVSILDKEGNKNNENNENNETSLLTVFFSNLLKSCNVKRND